MPRRGLSKAGAAIGAFVLLDAALIGGLLLQQRQSDSAAALPSSSTSTTAASSATEQGQQSAVVVRQLVSAGDKDVAWAVTTPSTCDGAPATLRWTTDGGTSWKTQELKGLVSGLQSGPNGAVVRMVGADCRTPETKRFDRSGKSSSGRDPDWVVSPTDSASVVTTGGNEVKPCAGRAVRDLATKSRSEAYVLCDGGEIRHTTDAKEFSTLANDSDVLAIATVGKDDELFVARSDDCGIGVGPVKDGRIDTSCVTQGAAPEGPADLSASGDTLWLVAGDRWYSGQAGTSEPWKLGQMTTGEGSTAQRG